LYADILLIFPGWFLMEQYSMSFDHLFPEISIIRKYKYIRNKMIDINWLWLIKW